jgi:hypothetical protein
MLPLVPERAVIACVAAVLIAGASACGIADRTGDESDRAYAQHLLVDCVDEHSGDVSSDETINSCWSEAVEDAVGNGDLPPEATRAVNRGDLSGLSN